MAVRRVQLRRGTHAQNDAFTGAVGEITVDTDNNSIRVHDGATAGGAETLRADMSNLGTNVLSVNGTVSFADSAGNSTLRLVNVADPTNNQDVATKAYVDSGGAGGINFADLADTDINDTNNLADGQMLLYDAGTGKWWNRALSGDATITDLGVITLSNGAITNAKIAIIDDDAITNAKLVNDNFSVTDGATTDSVALGATLTFSNVANETTVAVAADGGAGALVTIGLPDDVTVAGNLTVSNGVAITNDITSVRDITTTQDVDVGRDLSVGRNVTVTGNLTVSGTTTTIDSTTVSTADRVIELNKDIADASNVNDLGLFLKRGGGDPDALIIWDEGENSAAGAFVLATHADTDNDGVDGSTADFSGSAGMSYAPLFMGALTAESAIVEGNVTLKSDNALLSVQKADATSVFSVDSDNGNTTIAGTASITGTLGVTGVTTLDDTLAIPTGATTSSILINSNRAGTNSVDANIFAVERGSDGADATLTWDESETAFLLSNIFHSVGGLSIGGADPSAQTASLSSAGVLALDGSADVGTSLAVGTTATIGSTLTVTSTSALGGTATLDTDAFLLVKAGSNEASNLIVLNNDVDGQGGNPAAQDAKIAVRRGAASYATITWGEDETAWAFTNSGSFATDLSVGNDLTVTATASVNLLEVKGDGQSAIILNSDLGGGVAPTADVGITVERGSSADAKIYFDEVTDNTWKIDRGDGNGASEIILASDSIANSQLSNANFTVSDGATTDTVALGTTLTFNNVANETTVAVAADGGAGASVTVGLPDAVTLATSLTIGTLTISDGSIDDTDGSISLGSTNLTAVGTIASGTVTVGTTSFASGSITDTNGTVSFGDDNIKTIGNLQIRNAADSQDALLITANGDDATITSFGGDISFDNENLSTSGKITTGTLESTGQADFGASVVLSADNALLDVQKADNTSVFSVDSDNGNTLVGGTLGVTGLSTFTNNIIPSANGGGSVGVTGTRWGAVFADALTITNNATVGGTLGVTGVATFTSEAQLDGGIDVNASKFVVTAGSGDVVTDGTLRVKGATTLDGNVTVYDDTVAPNFTVKDTNDAAKFTVAGASGNTDIQGTLAVAGIPTFTSEAQLDGGIDVNGSKFVVTAGSGNVVTDGTLRVKGATTLDGDVAIYDDTTAPTLTVRDTNDAAKFTVAGASGNTDIQGTLDVVGVSTFTDDIVPSADGGADLGLTGTRWGNVFTDALAVTNNTTIGGTLAVTSTSTFTGQATFNGGIAGENGFSIADGTGAITTDSTLSVGGQTTIEAGLSSLNGNGGDETFGVLANGNTTIAGTLALAKSVTVNSADGSADLIVQNNAANKFVVEGDTGNTNIEGTLNVAGNTEVETGNFTVTAGDVTLTQGDLAITAGGITATAAASSFQAVSATSLSQSGGTLTLVSGGGAATDAFLKVERGATDADIKWDETSDKWQVNSGTGTFFTIVDANTTLFRLTAGGTNKDFSRQGTTDAFETLTINSSDGNVAISHSNNGTVSLGLSDNVNIAQSLTVGGIAQFSGATMRLADPMLFMGLNNNSATKSVGFYGQYVDGAENTLFSGLIFRPQDDCFKLFGTETGLSSTVTGIDPADSELADLDLKNLNVKGGGVTITKTTGKTVVEGVNSSTFTANEKSFQVTVTVTNTLTDGTRSATFTVESTSVSSTSVILATCNTHNVDVHPHTIVDGTSFKFDFTNRKGSQFSQNDTLSINFVLL